MGSSVTIREYAAGDREGILALLRKHFGPWSAERCAQRWQWQYHGTRGCNNCQSFIQVVEADEAIVGHIGAFPLSLRIGAKRFEVLCPGGFAVEPEHRFVVFELLKNLVAKNSIILGTGWSEAASKLFRRYGAETLPLSEVRYVYPLRHVGATQRELRQRLPASFRWMGNRWAAAMTAPFLDRRRGRKSKPLPRLAGSGDLRPISRFGEEYDELWRYASRQFTVSLDKNAAYMNWRYIDCPTTSHLCYGQYDDDSNLVGVVIACRRTHRDVAQRPCGEDGEIVELIVRDPDRQTVEQMVVPIMERLNRRGVDAIATMGLQPRLHPILEEIGFERTACRWGTLFAVSNDPDYPATDFLKDDLCYFTSGDGDHLFMPAL